MEVDLLLPDGETIGYGSTISTVPARDGAVSPVVCLACCALDYEFLLTHIAATSNVNQFFRIAVRLRALAGGVHLYVIMRGACV